MTSTHILNNTATLRSHLATRRSGRPREMVGPGPDAAQIAQIVTLAARTPDHGKLHPWRVVNIASDQRDALAAALRRAFLADRGMEDRDSLAAVEAMAHHAPALLIVLYCPRQSAKIPAQEQQLSAGAFTMNLLHATHALGFTGGWITGWAAQSLGVRDLFGSGEEQIIGFLYIGTPGQPLEDRPRPALGEVLSAWEPGVK